MKDRVKELKKYINERIGIHVLDVMPEDALYLIAEIESLETEIQAIASTFDSREEYIKQLEEEIGKLKRQKVLDVAYYDTKIKQLQTVREAAEEVDWQIINECLDEWGLIRIKASLKILQQALAEAKQ